MSPRLPAADPPGVPGAPRAPGGVAPDILLAVLSVALLGIAWLSLEWRMEHDAPILAYVAFLIDHFDRVPYLEIFEMNMPGTYAVHVAIGRLLGYGDFAHRLADLGTLAAILAATSFALRRLGGRVAACAALLFGLSYLGDGHWSSLQREVFVLLPLALSIGLAGAARPGPGWRAAGLGLLFGCAATVKPQAAIGLPALLAYAFGRDLARRLPAAALGFAAPLLATAAWLWSHGALGAFFRLARDYWPLYAQISTDLTVVPGDQRLGYLLHGYARGAGSALLALPASLGGLLWALRPGALPASDRRLVVLLAALAGLYSLYPLASGQLWHYHWLPYRYALLLLAALCLLPWQRGGRALTRWGLLGLLVLSIALGIRVADPVLRRLEGQRPLRPKGGRPDAIASYLRAHLGPGDTVQPLDWTGGAVHGMLLAEAELATSFVYDFHFYHHVGDPVIRALRARFLRELETRRPRFVIEVVGEKPEPRGPGTSRAFPELTRLLEKSYPPVHRAFNRAGQGFVVRERFAGEPSPALTAPDRESSPRNRDPTVPGPR